MTDLIEVDGLTVHVLVDNTNDSLSSLRPDVESEFAYLSAHGLAELSGDAICCACHGLAYLITATVGGAERTILFDAGPEEYAFERNVTRLGIDLSPVEAIVLSHGHWDHAGGMLKALELIRRRDRAKTIPYYAHPGMFRQRANKLVTGEVLPLKPIPGIDALSAHGATVIATTQACTLLDGLFYVSGEIPRVTPFERGVPGHQRRNENGDGWEPDPWLIDERFLAVHVRDKGIVVFSACSHAGIVNVLKEARVRFPNAPIHGVMGGFHLAGVNEGIIPTTVAELKSFDLKTIAAGHCTGWRATAALAAAFGDNVLVPTSVGKRYRF
jgi:7,8-dihydropterin-6-yl-methyl-4-(beta-D-ribofuranosyl)aminobenzene 5'-phosphate synthase